MKKPPLISVVVPIYNGQKYLKRCVKSILEQSYNHFEVILINDGSTDDSLDICRSYEDNDKRVRVIDQKNLGVAKSRNNGLEIATGSFVSFVDCDDFLLLNAYSELIELAIESDCEILQYSYNLIDVNGTILKHPSLVNSVVEGTNDILDHYLSARNSDNFPWNKLYKSSICKDILFPDVKYSEDFFFNTKVYSKCNKVMTTSKKLYNHMLHPDSAVGKGFVVEKLDILKTGENVFTFIEMNYPRHRHHISRYIINCSLLLSEDIIKSSMPKKDKKSHLKHIKSYFKKHYRLLSFEDMKKRFPNLYKRVLVFRISPYIYNIVINKIRRYLAK